jgi:uncharacterized membrane protein YkoI
MRAFLSGAAVALGVVLAFSAVRAEDKVPFDKVPKAVSDTVKARFEGAEWSEAAKEVEDGKTFYEISLKHKGKKIDVTVSEEGHVVSLETTIDAKAFPKAVAAAITKKYPGGKIEIAEEVMKVSYEAVVKHGNKTTEVVLDADGKITKDEDKKAGD